VSKSPPRARSTRSSPSGGSPRWLPWAIAGLFVLAVMAAVLISDLPSGSGAILPTPPAAIASRPSATPLPPTQPVPTSQPSPAAATRPTNTPLPVSPAGQVATPPPQWDELAAPFAVAGAEWNLLVLHTNDTWGYVLPCG